MNRALIITSVTGIGVGLIYFGLLMGAGMGLAGLNASLTPNMAWFPAPLFIAIAAVTLGVARRFDLRLGAPPAHGAACYAFVFLATLAAMGISVLEANWHGLTRIAPTWAGDVSGPFQLVFLFAIPFAAAVLAEIGFRGIIQGVLEPIMPLWPMLILIAILNALFHFYDPEQMSQWLRFLSLNIVWGYSTWLARSIRPALAAHITMNIIEPASEELLGPIAMGELSTNVLVAIAILSSVALLAGLQAARMARRNP